MLCAAQAPARADRLGRAPLLNPTTLATRPQGGDALDLAAHLQLIGQVFGERLQAAQRPRRQQHHQQRQRPPHVSWAEQHHEYPHAAQLPLLSALPHLLAAHGRQAPSQRRTRPGPKRSGHTRSGCRARGLCIARPSWATTSAALGRRAGRSGVRAWTCARWASGGRPIGPAGHARTRRRTRPRHQRALRRSCRRHRRHKQSPPLVRQPASRRASR